MLEVRQRDRTFLLVHLVVCALGSASTGAAAQEGYEAQQFHPAPDQTENAFSVHTGRILPKYGLSTAALLNHAIAPVRIEDTSSLAPVYAGPYSGNVLTSQTAVHALGAFAATEWLQLGLDVPVIVRQSSEAFTGRSSPRAVDESAGLGDVRVVSTVVVFQNDALIDETQITASFVVDAGLPTGDRDRYQGGGTRIRPLAVGQWRSGLGFRLAGNFGFAWRARDTTLGDEDIHDTFTWAGAILAPLVQQRLELLAEARGDLGTELLFGGRGRLGPFGATVAAGPGISALAPDFRAVIGFSFRHANEPPQDLDGDGLPDVTDECPREAEDLDGYQDIDGCPDPDNDDDGIADADDGCPGDPEDVDGFEDRDGCPDPDNDGDGIVDAQDVCVAEPEDHDGYQDGDGCPDLDNDNDGIPDADDRCPNDPEDPDGDEDDDGCPDIAPVVRIDTVVFFGTNSAELLPTHQVQLDKVGDTLIALPNHLHVFVEGHADDRGEPKLNQELALERAEAVRHYLLTRGVPADRLTARSYGSDKELRIGRTDPDRQGNRRVEFTIAPRSFVEESESEPGRKKKGQRP